MLSSFPKACACIQGLCYVSTLKSLAARLNISLKPVVAKQKYIHIIYIYMYVCWLAFVSAYLVLFLSG